MIKIYPSRVSVEALETHEHRQMTIDCWMCQNVKGYSPDIPQKVGFVVDGCTVPPSEWNACVISPESEVKVYPIPGEGMSAAAIATWVAAAVAAASAIYSIVMMSQMQKGGAGTANGDQLDLSPAKANAARLGDPIREVFGRFRIYPDYVVQPVSRFDKNDPQIYRTQMFLSAGVGELIFNASNMKIGSTPLLSFGDDVSVDIYPPGSDVSGDPRSENWFNSTEVGGTSSGTAGLDLASTGPSRVSIRADAVAISGDAIALIGQTAGDDSNPDTSVPESWKEGTEITVVVPDMFTVTSNSNGNVFHGNFTELNPVVGMSVSLRWDTNSYNLFVSSYDAGSPAVPGVGGFAASLTASAAPSGYDFTFTPLAFTLSWHGGSYVVSLNDDYVTMAGLTDAINGQLTGSGLIAGSAGGRLQIIEKSSPFAGGSVTATLLPVEIFGDSPESVSGQASTGGSPEVPPSLVLNRDNTSGAAFSGIPTGIQRIAFGARGNQYRITGIDGLTITVSRLKAGTGGNLIVDTTWPGFTPRTLLDAEVTGVNDDFDWMGPFQCCPEGEVTTKVELNLIYPNGLVDIGSKDGKIHWHEVRMTLQYRLSGTSGWTSVSITHGNDTVNMIGYTESITFPQPGNYEIRMRRDTPIWGGTTRDAVNWQALRAKLQKRPGRYTAITTIGLTVRTGTRLAAQSDRRVSVLATRNYETGTNRSIAGAFYHVGLSLGIDMDSATIDALQAAYWTPGGETFDFATSESTSALEMLQKIAVAGKSNFLLNREGLASISREGVKPWIGMITPHEMTEDLQTDFTAPSDDDFDGVDVTYVSPVSWAEETVQCRSPGNPTPVKVEDFKLDIAVSQDRAYQMGMRRLMKYQRQRLAHKTATEMDALCYNVDDHIVLTDDIPGSNTISCLIEDMLTTGGVTIFTVTEPLDWSFENPRAILRYQDGSSSRLLAATRVGDYQLSVAHRTEFDDIILDIPSIEPPRLVFCSSERDVYHATITEITPQSDGRCEVTAREYREDYYDYDDATYPGDTV